MKHFRMSLAELNAMSVGNMGENLGIEFTELGDGYVCGSMPVDHRTKQPMGLLHGGASAALAETLGSVGSAAMVDLSHQAVVGIEINANHLRKVTGGFVHGKASLLLKSRKLHVWEIRITDDEGELVCVSRLSVMVLEKSKS